MPTRNASGSNQSLKTDLYNSQNPLGGGVSSGQLARANFLKTASGRDLADSYKSKLAQYLSLSGFADKSDRENPESHNDGSADSRARLSADDFHDSELKPIRKELEARFLNTDGKAFWEKAKEDREDEQMTSDKSEYSARNFPINKLEYLMNVRISPESSVDMTVDVGRPQGGKINFSKVNDGILAGAITIARNGLADLQDRAIAKDNKVGKNDRYYEKQYTASYRAKVLDPLLNEMIKRNPNRQPAID